MLDDILHPPRTDDVGGDLRHQVSGPFKPGPAVQKDHVHDLLDDRSFPHDFHGRDAQPFLENTGTVAGNTAGGSPADIGMMGDIGNKGNKNAVIKNRSAEGYIWKMRSTALVWVISNEHVPGFDLFQRVFLADIFHNPQHGAEVHRDMFRLADCGAVRVKYGA